MHNCYMYELAVHSDTAGIAERADGMLMLIRHGQSHVVHQKRAYLCIKFIVTLCSRWAEEKHS